MKFYLTLFGLLICAITLMFVGCGPKAQPTPTPPATTGNVTASTPAPTLTAIQAAAIRTAATIATSSVFQFVVTDPAKRTTLANQMWSAGKAVYSLASGTFPSVATLQQTILSFGGNQADANYATFATNLIGAYSYAVSLANNNVQLAAQVLVQLGQGVDDAASSYETISTVTPVAN